MDAQEITLNIAANLSRICRWAMAGNRERVEQFLKDTETYVEMLERAQKEKDFTQTFTIFKKRFDYLKDNVRLNDKWAEDVLTWANILTHRAKLA